VAPQHQARRLTTILAADVVGYGRLMSVDESATLAALKTHRRDLIEPKTAEYGGRLIKLMGDGALMEFASVVDAVRFAVDVQREMAERNEAVPEDRRIAFRIGINIGDVIVEDDDLYGDGVNVAARLEALAEPGGICVSGDAYRQVRNKLDIEFADLGERELKNIAEPVSVYRVELDRRGARNEAAARRSSQLQQEIRFCATSDGVQIAYACVGDGAPLIKTANWLNHLEYDWQSPVWRHLLEELAKDHRLVRYDARGNGLSDWDVSDISFESFVRDLKTVVDAVGVERFALFAIIAATTPSSRSRKEGEWRR
jgi:class 3 adenylate cyclase